MTSIVSTMTSIVGTMTSIVGTMTRIVGTIGQQPLSYTLLSTNFP